MGDVSCVGVLLTGGASRRLGSDKAALVVRGERLADRAARVLAEVCDPVVEVGPGITGLPAVHEEPAGSGPLGALAAAAAGIGTTGGLLLLACDLPFVEPPLLRLLLDRPGDTTVVPVAGGEPQTVCARYSGAALAAAGPAFAGGARSLRTLLARVPHELVDESVWRAVAPPYAFVDVDTPADLARLAEIEPDGPGCGR